MSTPDTSEPDEAPRGKRGSPSNIPLAVSGVWLVLTGFAAAMPGDYWPLYGLSAAFALWGLMESDTPLRRMIALVLTTFSMTNGVMDFLVLQAGR